jgi:hypothetical protein
LKEFGEAAAVGGGRVYTLHHEGADKGFSIGRLYGTVKSLNEKIKNWKGE